MKRVGYLFDHLCSTENLFEAARKAARRKRYMPSTAGFQLNLEQNILDLRQSLLQGSFRFGSYCSFYIYEPKRRFISAAPYIDRVVHHALCNVLDPIFEQGFIHNLYSNREEKGVHKAVDRYQFYARQYRYVLKCDVSKYFASIDHCVLFNLIEDKIKDKKVLDLVAAVIYGFESDPSQQGKGMPLGNLTSQLFANIYLSQMDHWISEQSGHPAYLRYTDDWVVLSNDREKLRQLKQEIRFFLNRRLLCLHPDKTRIWKTSEGLNFLGYRVFPDYRKINRQNVKLFRRKLRSFDTAVKDDAELTEEFRAPISSWAGHASHADSFRLRQSLAQRYTFARDWLVKPFLEP